MRKGLLLRRTCEGLTFLNQFIPVSFFLNISYVLLFRKSLRINKPLRLVPSPIHHLSAID